MTPEQHHDPTELQVGAAWLDAPDAPVPPPVGKRLQRACGCGHPAFNHYPSMHDTPGESASS